jgi:hypothetical protein
MADADRSLSGFARQIQRADEGARATELGLRALHAELVEQRSPERSVSSRADLAAERAWAQLEAELEIGQ